MNITTRVVVFPPGSIDGTINCQNISIINDGVREEIQNITLGLNTTNSQVVLSTSSTRIIVIDNDSELKPIVLSICISTSMQSYIWILLFLAITFHFDKTLYTVEEGDDVQVCVLLTGRSAQFVQVTLSTVSNSAGKKYYILFCNLIIAYLPSIGSMDYDANFETTFVYGGDEPTVQCSNISSLNDGFVENEELFFVRLASMMALVNIPISSAQVNIKDNDGELY